MCDVHSRINLRHVINAESSIERESHCLTLKDFDAGGAHELLSVEDVMEVQLIRTEVTK